MGDHADDIIFAGIDGGWGWAWRKPPRSRVPAKPTCKRCGEPNLRWQKVKGDLWRLYNHKGILHRCKDYSPPAAASDFPYLEDE